MISKVIKVGIDQISEIEEFGMDKIEVDLSMVGIDQISGIEVFGMDKIEVDLGMVGIDQISEIEEFGMDKIEVDLGMNKITGMIIGEEISEVIWEHIKILEDRIIEVDIEEIIGRKMITEKEVGVCLEKYHFQE